MSEGYPLPAAVLLTGASSGIGRALAVAYARPGAVLHLGGRDGERLIATAKACRALGARVLPRVVDVADAVAMARWIEEADLDSPLELVIANAGVYPQAEENDLLDPAASAEVFQINVFGVLNTITPAIAPMRRRRYGQIAVMSSIASFKGHPMMPSYGASKAAVRVWGESLRRRLSPDGIGVTVVCPFHVATAICQVDGAMEVDEAACLIRDHLRDNPPRLAFPSLPYWRAWLSACLPPGLVERIKGRAHPISAPQPDAGASADAPSRERISG